MKDGFCEHHKRIEMGYVSWHNMATRRYSQKYTQVKCPVCEKYLFPDELNEPDNTKAQKVIENHNKYLEQHPRAKDVLAREMRHLT